MASDPSATSPTTGPKDKIRLLFRKDGPLRWLSHHDLMRTFERILRRSGLPFRSTRGFNPHPRLVFALSLPLGVVGRAEVVELELDEPLPPDLVRDRLAQQCPAGLTFLHASRIPPGQTAHVRGFTYGIAVPADRLAATQQHIATALAVAQWPVQRTRPAPRTVDIRPFIRDLRLQTPPDAIDQPGWLEMDLWLTPGGTARPDEVLGLVGLQDLLEAGATLERLRLELDSDDPPLPQIPTPAGQQ